MTSIVRDKSLRARASRQLSSNGAKTLVRTSPERLVHELQVHQIELEMQNEELRQREIALEALRKRYFDLYEFAPVCYITLSEAGRIKEINLTGTTLLGEVRNKLIHQRFTKYVLPVEQKRWETFFLNAVNFGGEQNCELRGIRKDGSVFDAYLVSRPIQTEDNAQGLFVTLADITTHKQMEATKRLFESRFSSLTRREREVLALAYTGMHNKEISARLNVNQRTVENHRAKIYKKLSIDSLLELPHQAASMGISLAEIVPPSKTVSI